LNAPANFACLGQLAGAFSMIKKKSIYNPNKKRQQMIISNQAGAQLS